MNLFLSQTYWDRNHSYPTNSEEENIYYSANSGEEYISLPSFFSHCLGKKDLVTVKIEKNTNLDIRPQESIWSVPGSLPSLFPALTSKENISFR